jgi:hypothetical protein
MTSSSRALLGSKLDSSTHDFKVKAHYTPYTFGQKKVLSLYSEKPKIGTQFFLSYMHMFFSILTLCQSGAWPYLLQTSSWWRISQVFGQFKPCKRFFTLQPDFSMLFDNFNDHIRNSIWPILDLYAIQLRLILKWFCRCFFSTFVKFRGTWRTSGLIQKYFFLVNKKIVSLTSHIQSVKDVFNNSRMH